MKFVKISTLEINETGLLVLTVLLIVLQFNFLFKKFFDKSQLIFDWENLALIRTILIGLNKKRDDFTDFQGE